MVRNPNPASSATHGPASATDRVAAQRGRVLRIKDGYNPNSSSVGSTLPAYLAFAVGSGAVTVLVLNLLGGAGRLLRKQRDNESTSEAPSSEQDRGDERAEQNDE